MDVVRSTRVQRWHLEGAPPILIELELATADGDGLGITAALLSPALADELGVRLQLQAAADFGEPPTGPDRYDVDRLTSLLDLMDGFASNEQRARYLLSCNWLRERGAIAAVMNAQQLAALRAAADTASVGS